MGRGHQFLLFYECNELEVLTGESTVANLGQEREKCAEITGPRSSDKTSNA